jgi:hypothetical protein
LFGVVERDKVGMGNALLVCVGVVVWIGMVFCIGIVFCVIVDVGAVSDISYTIVAYHPNGHCHLNPIIPQPLYPFNHLPSNLSIHHIINVFLIHPINQSIDFRLHLLLHLLNLLNKLFIPVGMHNLKRFPKAMEQFADDGGVPLGEG